jgi:conjugal transfer/entry exclusion protein
MPTPEMQKAIGQLRLLLAAIKGKDEDLANQQRQFRRQMDRVPMHAIRGSSIDASLSIMAEIQERLDNVQTTRGHLAEITSRAQAELEALEPDSEGGRGQTQAVQPAIRTLVSGGRPRDPAGD